MSGQVKTEDMKQAFNRTIFNHTSAKTITRNVFRFN